MRARAPWLSLVVLLATACSCLASAWEDAIVRRVSEAHEKIRSYEGTFVERGVVPGEPATEVTGRIRFRAPSTYVVEILSPDAYKGDAFAWIGSSVWIYSEHLHAGNHLANVPGPAPSGWREVVAETVHLDLASYAFQENDKEPVGGRVAIPWTVTPRETGDLLLKARVWMDDTYLVPLRVELARPRGEGRLYEFAFKEVRFNSGADDSVPPWTPPEAVTWLEWDLAARPLQAEEARGVADFKLLEPGEEVAGLRLARVVKARTNVVPILATVYERGPFFATVVQSRDVGVTDARARGLELDLGTPAKVTFVGATTLLTLVRDGTAVTLWTNLPPPLAARFARSLRPR